MRKPTKSEIKAYNTTNIGILYRILDSSYLPAPIPIELTDNPAYRYEAIAPNGFIFSANDAHTILGRSLKELSIRILEGIETEPEE